MSPPWVLPCVSPGALCVTPGVTTACVTLEDPGDLAPPAFSASSPDLSVLSCLLWLLSFSPGLKPRNLGCACQARTHWWGCRGHCARGGRGARDGRLRRAGPQSVAWLQRGSWALVPRTCSWSRQLRPVQAPCPGWLLPWSQERPRKHKRQDGKLKPSQLTRCCDEHSAHRQTDTNGQALLVLLPSLSGRK